MFSRYKLSCKQVLPRSSQSCLLAQIMQICTRVALGSICQLLHSSNKAIVTLALMKHITLPGIAAPIGCFTLLRGHA